ncbi:MAG: tryptophan--tRNA ligase [Syntrophales bacterium]|nr:tryptophan--tRNA ligase [Syntrophales bacterium]
MVDKKRILSGMRPTGRLHLGNLHGALRNWVELQNDGRYECFYFVADWHALTSDFNATEYLQEYTMGMVRDWLAVGLDPERSTLFIQSSVKEHAELFVLFSMITPLSWLERNPTYKEMREEMVAKDLSNFGFLGYPVLQAADIVMYKAYGVPVGVDQLPHVELTREIVRRFNYLYGPVFQEPEALLTDTPKILGTDGRKMSKSYDNSIYIDDQGETLQKKIMSMFTDPQRQRRRDPGRPELCNVFTFHHLYSAEEKVREIEEECRRAGIGCTDCKTILAEGVGRAMAPIHERLAYLQGHEDHVRAIIAAGNARAQAEAGKTMEEVRRAVKIHYGL